MSAQVVEMNAMAAGRLYHCHRCGRDWAGRETPPKHCRWCTSALWNVPRGQFHCKRCGHHWTRQNEGTPVQCQACHSPNWDRDELRWHRCWCGNAKAQSEALCAGCVERLPDLLRAKLPVAAEGVRVRANLNVEAAQRWLQDNPPRLTPQCYWPLAQALLFQWARLRSVIGSPVRLQMARTGAGGAVWGVAKGNTAAMIVFVVDMEKALAELSERSRAILALRSEGEHFPAIARSLQVGKTQIERGYPAALDELSEVLLRRRILHRMPEVEAATAGQSIAVSEWVYEAERGNIAFDGYNDEEWQPAAKDEMREAAIRELSERFAPAEVHGVNRVAWAKGFIAGWNGEAQECPYLTAVATVLLRGAWNEGYAAGLAEQTIEPMFEPEFVSLAQVECAAD